MGFRNTWILTTPRSESGESAELYLTAGRHQTALSNNSYKGLNLDWLALSGNGWTSPPSWGHLHPDAGSVVFYWGDTALLPGVDYPREKWTTNHSVGVFSIYGQNRPVGQIGEGGRWGQDNEGIKAHPKMLKVVHTGSFHGYLMDLGGSYPLENNSGGSPIFPDYKRAVVYFPVIDSLLISDWVSSPVEGVFHSRLMTAADTMIPLPESSAVKIKIGDKAGIIRNFSNTSSVVDCLDEIVSSWPIRSPRKVLRVQVKVGNEPVVTSLLLSPGNVDPADSLTPEALQWIEVIRSGSFKELLSLFH